MVLHYSHHHRELHSFPTRRSSDLTKIWHFCHIMPHAKIVAGCNLGQNVLVSSHVEIGNNVKIQNNRSEEHTSELQSPVHPVCRLLLDKKKIVCNRKHS